MVIILLLLQGALMQGTPQIQPVNSTLAAETAYVFTYFCFKTMADDSSISLDFSDTQIAEKGTIRVTATVGDSAANGATVLCE